LTENIVSFILKGVVILGTGKAGGGK